MTQYNIIGDVAGRFDEFLLLKEQMPAAPFIFVGDLNDRGPQSKEMIQWCMDSGSVCLQSNHGDMMVDFLRETGRYGPPSEGVWFSNGGGAAMRSYDYKVPVEHVDWLAARPKYFQDGRLFVSHAAWSKGASLEEVCAIEDDKLFDWGSSIIWSRNQPQKREDLVQIFGHNSHWGLKYFGPKKNPWAICIDDSRKEVLTGITWPELVLHQVPFREAVK